MSDSAALHAIAQGRVQGVYLSCICLPGLPSDSAYLVTSVTCLIVPWKSAPKAQENQLEKLVEQLKEGPPGARVDNLELTWSEYTGQYSDFSVTR